ncbi:MAG: hypothetical protein ACRC92_26400 [Peptostreptococcaceae bacterium]
MKTLKVIVNNECNLSCGYCTSCVPALNTTLDIDKLTDNLLSNYESFLITGGEPTLIGDSLHHIIRRLFMFSDDIMLNSNCVMVATVHGIMKSFDKLKLAISFDGVSSRNISNYDTVVEMFMIYGDRLYINYTIDWFNIESTYDNISMLLDLGIPLDNIDIAFINVTSEEYSEMTDENMLKLYEDLSNLNTTYGIVKSSLFSRVKSKNKGCGESGGVILPNGELSKCQPNILTYNTPVFKMINGGGFSYIPKKCRDCELDGCGMCVNRAFKQTGSIDDVAERFCDFNRILFRIWEESK